eukprot:scaffold442_cov268-Pinguiococcus_pyrenoidosus.AAC.65
MVFPGSDVHANHRAGEIVRVFVGQFDRRHRPVRAKRQAAQDLIDDDARAAASPSQAVRHGVQHG